LDGATSSKKLHTMERSKIGEDIWFRREYFSGVTVSGSKDKWDYLAGFYSSDGGPEFDDAFDAGTFVLLSLGYDLSEKYGVDNALVRLDFVSNEEDPDNGTQDHETVVSLVGKYDNGPRHLWADLSFSQGYGGQSDLFGLQIMPFYDFSKQSQIIFSYTYMKADDGDAVRLGRYERRNGGGLGNKSSEYYLGYNHFFHGHKLKWQTGIQYSNADATIPANEYDGLGFSTGFRISW
jgi:phosphate-selective porin OprO/OprP